MKAILFITLSERFRGYLKIKAIFRGVLHGLRRKLGETF
jgi:hypothetical protein